MIDISFLELIEITLLLISLVIILIASIKLSLNNKIPNSKLLLVAYVGSVIGVLLPLVETFYTIENSYLFNSLVNIYLGIMFVTGAYGFWCLVQHATKQSTNKLEMAQK